jgi:hypothetical protein
LAFHDLQIGSHIASALLAIPDIPKKNLEDQMKYPILEPTLQKLKSPMTQ